MPAGAKEVPVVARVVMVEQLSKEAALAGVVVSQHTAFLSAAVAPDKAVVAEVDFNCEWLAHLNCHVQLKSLVGQPCPPLALLIPKPFDSSTRVLPEHIPATSSSQHTAVLAAVFAPETGMVFALGFVCFS